MTLSSGFRRIAHSPQTFGKQARFESNGAARSVERAPSIPRTHSVSFPLHDGTLAESVIGMRTLLNEKGFKAKFPQGYFARRLGKSLMLRVASVNIKGYPTSPRSVDDGSTPSFELREVQGVLESVKETIKELLNGATKLTLTWGFLRPMGPPGNSDIAKLTGLTLIPHYDADYNTINAIDNLVYQKLLEAGMVRPRLTSRKPRIQLARTSTWKDPQYFHGKILFTIPGFDKYRMYPLPKEDTKLLTGIAVDLGVSDVKSLVLEPMAFHDGEREFEDEAPAFDGKVDFI